MLLCCCFLASFSLLLVAWFAVSGADPLVGQHCKCNKLKILLLISSNDFVVVDCTSLCKGSDVFIESGVVARAFFYIQRPFVGRVL